MNILEFDETSSYCLISVLKEFIIKMKFHQYDKISYDKRFFVMRKKLITMMRIDAVIKFICMMKKIHHQIKSASQSRTFTTVVTIHHNDEN